MARPARSVLVLALASAVAASWGLAWPAPAAAPASAAASAAPRIVIYPSAGAANDNRGSYYVRLLRLALDKSDQAFEIQPSRQHSVNLRVRAQIAAGHGMDVTWSPTSMRLEQELRPIRISLDKGLLGWRVFLIEQRDREAFAAVRTLDDLRRFDAGLVTEWEDTAILRANGLPVIDTPIYQNLFRMLAAHRFRYFPRGIGEVDGEARNYADLGLVVEPHVALHYPFCTYFFVRKDDDELATQLELGLRRALKDGSFEALFQQANGAAVQRADLAHRVILELRNPLMAEDEHEKDGCSDPAQSIHRLTAR
jgi:hypothetical protein